LEREMHIHKPPVPFSTGTTTSPHARMEIKLCL
jgi:hypothetical protein